MQGTPDFYAQQFAPRVDAYPPHVDMTPTPLPPPHQGDTDNDAQWTGIAVVGGGVVLSMALLGWLAFVNKREHSELESKVEGVDSRLFDYQQAHALVHTVLQAQIAALQGHHVPPTTLYGAPAGYPSFIPPAMTPAPMAMTTPPQYGQYSHYPPQPAYVQPPLLPAYVAAPLSAPPPPMAPPSQRPTFVLPKHLEGAITSAARDASRAANRTTHPALRF